MRNTLSAIIFSIITWSAAAQMTISGKVTDQSGDGIPGITVQVKGSTYGVSSDIEGNYRLKNLSKGTITIVFAGVGFKSQEQEVNLQKSMRLQAVRMAESTTELNAVQVVGKTEVAELRERPFAVTAIDVQPLKVQNLDVNQILNTTTGVRIREEGGLGSNFNFSLNGFSGSQVKFFLDGMPMDYFGSSLSLNNIPANLISKIEVYKGVVPVSLGSDALGGAVNITTNSNIKKYLNVSYSIGSFNTHRASVVSRCTTANGFVVHTNAFYNYSKNNYRITANVVDFDTGKGTDVEVERFHDGYESKTVQLELGVEDKPFADRLLVGVLASGNHKEIQNGYNINIPIGEAYTEDRALIATLKYQKSDFLINGLDIKLNANHKHGKSHRIDTASRTYNWLGESKPARAPLAGELNYYKTRFIFTDNALLASGNALYTIDKNQHISVNNNYSHYTRVGDDPISPASEEVAFSQPNTLEKNILGFSYSLQLFDSKLRAIAFGKMMTLNALTREDTAYNEYVLVDIRSRKNLFGYGTALTYFVMDELQVKSSYEYTTRLPSAYELFGNGLQVLSNPRLEPERSYNFNVGVISQNTWGKHQLMGEIGYLYRLPKNLIFPLLEGNNTVSQNLESSKINSFEADLRYDYDRRFNLQVNGTFQDIVDNSKLTETGGENYQYGARLPNTPYLFGNAKVGYVQNLRFMGVSQSKVSFNWSTQFVEAFYLKWPNLGDKDTKAGIPRQLSHNASLAFSFADGRYNAALSCTNVFDAALFDNYLLQKPGRAYNLKLSYFLK